MRIGKSRRRSSDHDGALIADSRPKLDQPIFSELDFDGRRELADIDLGSTNSDGAAFSLIAKVRAK